MYAPTYAEIQAMRLADIIQEEPESDAELIHQLLREAEQQAAINAAPVNVKHGVDHSPTESGQIMFQRCGGGVRTIRKKIGGA